jgi:hypothetical protein
MGVFLSHIGLEPIIYGIVIAIGLMVMWIKFAMRRWLSLVVDIVVFWLVFTLHGGTMTGGMAAAIAALICGLVFPLILRRRFG